MNQGPILTDYLRTVFWPDHLVFTYGEPRPLDFSSASPFLALIVLLLAATGWTWWRKPAIGFPAVAFFVILAPTSTIVPIATEVGAERRMYLPLAALIALVVVLANAALERLTPRRTVVRASRIGAVMVALSSILLIALTSRRNSDYVTSEALWQSTVVSWPSAVAHRNLATSLKLAGRRDEALAQFRIASQERPEVRRIVGQELYELGSGRSQLALADSRLQLRDFNQAAERYRRYLALQPDDAHALINLGIALLSLGDASPAVEALKRATELEPANANAHRNLAVALAQQGDLSASAEHAARAASLAPDDGSARELLAQILSAQRRPH